MANQNTFERFKSFIAQQLRAEKFQSKYNNPCWTITTLGYPQNEIVWMLKEKAFKLEKVEHEGNVYNITIKDVNLECDFLKHLKRENTPVSGLMALNDEFRADDNRYSSITDESEYYSDTARWETLNEIDDPMFGLFIQEYGIKSVEEYERIAKKYWFVREELLDLYKDFRIRNVAQEWELGEDEEEDEEIALMY